LSCDEFSVSGAPFEFVLPRGLDAPGVARRLLRDWFAPALANGVLATARLLVSELVTNAVCHGRGKITLRAQLFDERLLVEVIDEGQTFKRELRDRDSVRIGAGGLGLSIVDAESSRWGIRRGTTRVWFELDRPKLGSKLLGNDLTTVAGRAMAGVPLRVVPVDPIWTKGSRASGV
jgi:anti-sigma regulatory factor (Ser/Thr protein kinase)